MKSLRNSGLPLVARDDLGYTVRNVILNLLKLSRGGTEMLYYERQIKVNLFEESYD